MRAAGNELDLVAAAAAVAAVAATRPGWAGQGGGGDGDYYCFTTRRKWASGGQNAEHQENAGRAGVLIARRERMRRPANKLQPR